MKTLTRVAFYALAFGFVPCSYSYAQNSVDPAQDMTAKDVAVDLENQDEPLTLEEADHAIAALPGAKDAVKGPIDTHVDGNVYDIYGRQLSYREGSKEFRTSIETRRDNFAEPRAVLIEQYEETRDKVYAAETAAYQQNISETELTHDKAEKQIPVAITEQPKFEAPAVEVTESEGVGLKEQEIPEGKSEAGAQLIKRKVITAEDAPKFDPAKLKEKPEAVSAEESKTEESKPVPVKKPAQAELMPVPTPKNVPAIEDTKEPVKAHEEKTDVEENTPPSPAKEQAEEPKEALGNNAVLEIPTPIFPVIDDNSEEIDSPFENDDLEMIPGMIPEMMEE
ncbi:MAG: hypothetical protein KAJ40_03345 [Alphaproteobacteria bacterium]|nr:hypothetical protein [Alphaproteobacteria bacterium]